jgi:hypothetical protein
MGLIGVIVAAAAAVLAAAQVLAVEQPTLRVRLEKGLKARTDADFAFLDRVVEAVEEGDLPQKLVDRVFFWARKEAAEHKGSKAKRPMIYFRPALKILAERIGLELS